MEELCMSIEQAILQAGLSTGEFDRDIALNLTLQVSILACVKSP